MPNRWEQSKILCCECVGFESLRTGFQPALRSVAELQIRIPKEAHLVFELTPFQASKSGKLKSGPNSLTFSL